MSHEAATPKQVAYLRFMGHPKPDRLSKADAGKAIEGLGDVQDYAQWERIEKRKEEWLRQRFVLYPDLYRYEFQTFLIHELPEALHRHVRSRMVGASGRLTKTKIRQVINKLGREHADWWKADDFKERFLAKLTEMHPDCCNGRTPDAPPKVQAGRRRGSGCLVQLLLWAMFVAVVVVYAATR